MAGRQVPTGLDAFVYTERGVYRSGETAHVTALLRDALGAAARRAAHFGDGAAGRRRISPRAGARSGLGGHSWSVPIVRSASTGTWHLRAFTDPKRPPVGETTFLVEDYVPDRIEFDLTSRAVSIPRGSPGADERGRTFPLRRAGLQSRSHRRMTIAAAKERPGFAGYSFGLATTTSTAVRQELDDLPATDAAGKASFPGQSRQDPDHHAPARGAHHREHGGIRRPRGRAQDHAAGRAERPMIGVKPAFSGRSLADGANADFDVVVAAPDGKTLAQSGLHYELLRIETYYQWYTRRQLGIRAGQAHRARQRRHRRRDADKPARISLPVKWGRYRLEVSTPGQNGLLTSVTFDAGFYAESSSDTPDLWKSRSTRTISNRATP